MITLESLLNSIVSVLITTLVLGSLVYVGIQLDNFNQEMSITLVGSFVPATIQNADVARE
jgi:hypothetical protein